MTGVSALAVRRLALSHGTVPSAVPGDKLSRAGQTGHLGRKGQVGQAGRLSDRLGTGASQQGDVRGVSQDDDREKARSLLKLDSGFLRTEESIGCGAAQLLGWDVNKNVAVANPVISQFHADADVGLCFNQAIASIG